MIIAIHMLYEAVTESNIELKDNYDGSDIDQIVVKNDVALIHYIDGTSQTAKLVGNMPEIGNRPERVLAYSVTKQGYADYRKELYSSK
jgi:hypothetical protein